MGTTSFADALAALVPPSGADEPRWIRAIEDIARLVLTRTVWHMGAKPHRFTEVEFYVNSPNHKDTFTHGDVMQTEFARWYHHRTGGEYRGGTYKGLDLAFGSEGTHAGMLIRGVESIDDPSKIYDGPCVCVDHLLSLSGFGDVPLMVKGYDRDVSEKPGSPSYLTLTDERAHTIYRGPRVGLSLKRGASEPRVRYLSAPYRFLTEPSRIKKGRLNLVCGLHRQGVSADEIARLTGSKLTQVKNYIEQYDAGRDKDPKDYRGDLSTDQTCQLFGACERFAPAT